MKLREIKDQGTTVIDFSALKNPPALIRLIYGFPFCRRREKIGGSQVDLRAEMSHLAKFLMQVGPFVAGHE